MARPMATSRSTTTARPAAGRLAGTGALTAINTASSSVSPMRTGVGALSAPKNGVAITIMPGRTSSSASPASVSKPLIAPGRAAA